jgi:poly-gamma-glutamate synthesis protein (capsule biosynthesis protein)
VDVLVVSMHWGRNYAPVSEDQERDARFLAALGVDVIAGHHPHDIQPVEWIDDTLVLYSLGNYAWGTPGRASMKVGLLARLRIRPRHATGRGRLWAVELVPLLTQNRLVAYRPRPLRRTERRYLRTFLKRSRARGARLRWLGRTNTLRLTVPVQGSP